MSGVHGLSVPAVYIKLQIRYAHRLVFGERVLFLHALLQDLHILVIQVQSIIQSDF